MRRPSKKISIFIDYEDDECSSSSSMYTEDIFQTKNSIHGLGDIKVPRLELTQ